MTILIDGRVFSTTAHDRGMGRYTQFLVETIAAAGFNPRVILYKNFRFKPECPTEFLDFDTSSYREQDTILSTQAIEALIKKHNAIAFIDATPFLFPMCSKITACPVIAVAYDLLRLRRPREYYSDFTSFPAQLYQNGIRRLIQADAVLAISEYTKELIFHYLGILPDRTLVLYPCLEPEYLAAPPVEPKTLDFFAIVSSHFAKNPQFSLNLFNQLKDRPYKLTSPRDSELDELKTYFPLAKSLSIKSSISEQEKIRHQTRAKVVFHLSTDEGFGIPLLEALFRNTRVICCDIKINREILAKASPETALLIPTNSFDLAQINRFIDSPEQHPDAFSQIRSYFNAHWTLEAPQIIHKLLSIISIPKLIPHIENPENCENHFEQCIDLDSVEGVVIDIAHQLDPGGLASIHTLLKIDGPEGIPHPDHCLLFTPELIQKHIVQASGLSLIGELDPYPSPQTFATRQNTRDFLNSTQRPAPISFHDGFLYCPVYLQLQKPLDWQPRQRKPIHKRSSLPTKRQQASVKKSPLSKLLNRVDSLLKKMPALRRCCLRLMLLVPGLTTRMRHKLKDF